MNVIDRVRVILWKLSLVEESVCPLCGRKLKERGFVNTETHRFECPDDYCDFS